MTYGSVHNLTIFTLQVLDEKKLTKSDDLYKDFETAEGASKVITEPLLPPSLISPL